MGYRGARPTNDAMLHRSRISLTAVTAVGLLGAILAPAVRPDYAPGAAAVTDEAAPTTRAGQDADEDQDEPAHGTAAARAKRIAALSEDFEGAWRLVSMRPPPPTPEYARVSGMLLVDEHVVSLIAHGDPNPNASGRTAQVVQSGFYYWRIGPRLTLEMAAILGHHNAGEEARIEGEPQLEPREFEIAILGSRLVLSKRDGTRLEFDRFEVNGFPPEAARFIDALRAGRNLDDLRRGR